MAVLSYVLLGIGTVIAVATEPMLGQSGRHTAAMLGVAMLCAGWIWWWTTAHPQWATSTSRMATYYFVRTAVAFALTWMNPFYAFFAFVGYLDAFRYFQPRPAMTGIAMTAFTMAGSQSGGLPPQGAAGWAVLGVIYVMNLGLGGCFAYFGMRENEVNEARVEMIADLETANARLEAALAENAALQKQLVSQAREAGVDDERQRLAREIHDTIAQGLAGIVTQLQAATDAADPPAARTHVERAAALARDSLDDARRSVRDLSPTELDDSDLPKALDRLVTSWSSDANVFAELTVTGTEVRLHDEIESTLLRIVQEGLTNVRKHAGAHRVGVTLSYMGDEVTVDVRDDGRGFRRGEPNGTGYGLRTMRQRAERIAGTLDVESEPDAGTAISARVPSVARHE